jgi:hypothetical protein
MFTQELLRYGCVDRHPDLFIKLELRAICIYPAHDVLDRS